MNNLHEKSTARRKEKLNYDIFTKIVGRSCIIEELREGIFGTWMWDKNKDKKGQKSAPTKTEKKEEPELTGTRSESIFKVDNKMDFKHGHLFNNITLVMDEVSYGQRNYERNLEALLGIILKTKEKKKKPGDEKAKSNGQ